MGCSSIVSKSEYAVAIDSEPSAANFTVTNKAGQRVHSGMTPATVTLRASSGFFKGESYIIAVDKQGYRPHSYNLVSTVDGWYFGNILVGGLIGMLIVDPATGAMYKLPGHASVKLEPSSAASSTATDLRIATIDTLTEAELARLERLQ